MPTKTNDIQIEAKIKIRNCSINKYSCYIANDTNYIIYNYKRKHSKKLFQFFQIDTGNLNTGVFAKWSSIFLQHILQSRIAKSEENNTSRKPIKTNIHFMLLCKTEGSRLFIVT